MKNSYMGAAALASKLGLGELVPMILKDGLAHYADAFAEKVINKSPKGDAVLIVATMQKLEEALSADFDDADRDLLKSIKDGFGLTAIEVDLSALARSEEE